MNPLSAVDLCQPALSFRSVRIAKTFYLKENFEMGSCIEGFFTALKTTSNPGPHHKSQNRQRLSAATLILLAAVLCSPAILLFRFPQIITFPITARYPKCGHIVLVSDRRHGSTWFISNAEGCLSVNGSYGDLIRTTEIWNYGWVQNVTVEDAINLVMFETSVKIFPDALHKRRKELRAFLRAMRDLQVPVFVLRRNLERSFSSLQAALETKKWDRDNGGVVVQREFKPEKWFSAYKSETEAYFERMKKLMNELGVAWDEVQYETILSQRLILGRTAKCYIQNCNFANRDR